MTYDTAEKSIQGSRPVELYKISTAQATYLLTSHDDDVSFHGQVYTATPVARGNIMIGPLGKERQLMVSLPVGHPSIAILFGNGFPPRDTRVSITRTHLDSPTDFKVVWDGYIQSIETDDELARVHTQSIVDDTFGRVRLPVLKAQRSCNHVLYDKGCRISSGAFLQSGSILTISPFIFSTTIVSVNGSTVQVASINGKPDGFFRHGPFQRDVDSEQRTINEQVGTTLTLSYPMGVLNIGDVVTIRAGCNNTIATCRDKFANVKNFGGMPSLPTSNPGSPTGLGVMMAK